MNLPSGDIPSGTVTFLFTDVEASTRLWEAHPTEMKTALERHDAILRGSIESHDGYVFKTVGDAFCAAFEEPLPATRAAVEAQRLLSAEPWSPVATIRVRMAIHSGACHERGGDYFGPPVNRAARLLVLGHGGQVLVSGVTADLLSDGLTGRLPGQVSLRDLGRHRLKDLERPERVFQLCAPQLGEKFGPLVCVDTERVEHNLPRSATHFVGRATEVAAIRRQLADERSGLVTLTGSGGVGKTRLALEVATQLLEGPGEAVWLVELAHVAASDHVAQKIATVLAVREEPGRPVLDSVVEALRDRDVTIVLDNCEHVVTASAEAADAVLRSCDNVRLLATSREPLGIDGEHVHRVPSLGVPPEDTDPSDLIGFESVQLFCERAVHHRPGFALASSNMSAMSAAAAICRQLDGIPLAIELAAARLRTMSVEEIEERLDARFRLLTGGLRTALPRQKTLRASIDWSYELLSADEQILLDRLSVFTGGFELDSAEAVCSIMGTDTLALLPDLVDKSLVEADEVEDQIRYRLLETVRQYAAERLEARGTEEVSSARRAHRDHFLGLAEQAALRVRQSDGLRWLDVLEIEHANLRAALAFCLADGEVECGLRLAVALRLFWSVRGYGIEALDTLDALLDEPVPEPGALQVRAMTTTAYLLGIHGSYEEALVRARRAVDIARASDNSYAQEALLQLGSLLRITGDHEGALNAYEEVEHFAGEEAGTQAGAERAGGQRAAGARAAGARAAGARAAGARAAGARAAEGRSAILALASGGRAFTLGLLGRVDEARSGLLEAIESLDKSGDRWDMTALLCDLASLELESDDHDSARAHLDDALAVAEDLGDEVHKCYVEAGLGAAAILGSDAESAFKWYIQALGLARRTGNRALVARSITGLGIVLAELGESRRAAMLFGAAARIYKELGYAPRSIEAKLSERRSDQVRDLLGVGDYARAVSEGSKLSDPEAVSLAVQRPAVR